eukprot:PITA_05110
MFVSQQLSKDEKNYSITDREVLAMVYALQNRHYLLGGHFKMYTNHSSLKYVVNKPLLGGTYADGFYCFKNMTLRSSLSQDALMQDQITYHELRQILMEAHGGGVGGHCARHATARRILRARLWSPTLHQVLKAHYRACNICQRTGKPSRRDEMPLNPQMTVQSFEKWAINFVGPIKPQGKTSAHYIITAMEYLT